MTEPVYKVLFYNCLQRSQKENLTHGVNPYEIASKNSSLSIESESSIFFLKR